MGPVPLAREILLFYMAHGPLSAGAEGPILLCNFTNIFCYRAPLCRGRGALFLCKLYLYALANGPSTQGFWALF